MQRGEVWWARLPQPAGRRPVVLVSRNQAIQVRQAVTVASVTSTIRNLPVEIKLGPPDGVPKRSVINVDVLNTIPKAWLESRIALLSPEKRESLNSALRFSLGLD